MNVGSRWAVLLCVLFVAIGLTACGDDSPGDPTPEDGRDGTVEDVDGDTTLPDTDTDADVQLDAEVDGDGGSDSEGDAGEETDGNTPDDALCGTNNNLDTINSYFIGLSVEDEDEPLIVFTLAFEAVDTGFEAFLQPVAAADCDVRSSCGDNSPGDRLGEKLRAGPFQLESDGTFTVSRRNLMLPAAANTIDGTELSVDLELVVSNCTLGFLCGEATLTETGSGGTAYQATMGAIEFSFANSDPILALEIPTTCDESFEYRDGCDESDARNLCPCDEDADCAADVCITVEGESYCSAACDTDPDCYNGDEWQCEPLSSEDSDVCVPRPTCLAPDPEGFSGSSILRVGTSLDGDLLCDDVEAGLSFGTTDCDQSSDCDGDGIDDAAEVLFGSDEAGGSGWQTAVDDPDTDNDGIDDGAEIDAGSNPLFPEPSASDDTTAFQGDVFSYVSGIQVADETCCSAVLDADPQIDNSLAELIESLSSLSGSLDVLLVGDLNLLLSEGIEDGEIVGLVLWDQLPTDFSDGVRADTTANFYTGSILDASTLDDRRSGEGEYSLGTLAGEPLPLQVVRGELLSGTSTLTFPIRLNAVLPTLFVFPLITSDIPLILSKATISGEFSEQTTSAASETTRGLRSSESLAVSGAIKLADIAASWSDAVEPCYPDSAEPTFSAEDAENGSSKQRFACAIGVPDTSALGGACADIADILPTVCTLYDTIFGPSITVDTDDDGIADAISAGFLLELSGAADTTD